MNEPIKLFSKKVIFVFSILMSPVFGCLLFADNLNQANRKNYILPVVAGGFLYNMVFAFVLRSIISNPQMLLIALQIVNIAGAFILVGPIWKALLGDIEEYEKKSFVGPLVILILITIAITLFVLKTGKPLL